MKRLISILLCAVILALEVHIPVFAAPVKKRGKSYPETVEQSTALVKYKISEDETVWVAGIGIRDTDDNINYHWTHQNEASLMGIPLAARSYELASVYDTSLNMYTIKYSGKLSGIPSWITWDQSGPGVEDWSVVESSADALRVIDTQEENGWAVSSKMTWGIEDEDKSTKLKKSSRVIINHISNYVCATGKDIVNKRLRITEDGDVKFVSIEEALCDMVPMVFPRYDDKTKSTKDMYDSDSDSLAIYDSYMAMVNKVVGTYAEKSDIQNAIDKLVAKEWSLKVSLDSLGNVHDKLRLLAYVGNDAKKDGTVSRDPSSYNRVQLSADDPDEDTIDDMGVLRNKLSWKNWYMAATAIALNKSFSDGSLKLGDRKKYIDGVVTEECLYTSYANLKELIGSTKLSTADSARLLEVLSIAKLGGKTQTLIDWMGEIDIDEEMNTIAKSLKGSGSASLDAATVDGHVSDIKANGQSVSTELVRFSTLSSRLRVILFGLGDTQFDIGSERYSWLIDSYGQNYWYMVGSMFRDENTPLLRMRNSNIQIATDMGSNNSQADLYYYGVYTILEIPYFTQFFLQDMNNQISANTEISNNQLYKAVMNIKRAKDELNMPVLDSLWEMEIQPLEDTTNIQYKTLKDVYEQFNKLGASGEGVTENLTPLETGKPLKWFFKDYGGAHGIGRLSDYYVQGIAYTATLVPMRSNVYSEEWRRYMNPEFYKNFWSLWGYNRKALMLDKSSGAGEAYFSTGGNSKGSTRVCTLRDLLDAKSDVVLYLDDNFYNADDVRVNPFASPDTPDNDGEESLKVPWWSLMAGQIEEAYSTSFDQIVKTGTSTNYSKVFYDMMSKLEKAHVYYPEATVETPGNKDNAVMQSGRINYYLDSGNPGSEVYSPIQAYAVVSSVYRDADLFNKANSREAQQPVFIASNNAPYMKNASTEAISTIFNYALMRNLKESMAVDYASNIDLDCPIYMDILGNIVTESGMVVVPAASNATLMSHDQYHANMWAAGLFTVYGLDYKIPVSEDEGPQFATCMEQAFDIDEAGEFYIPKPRTLGGDGFTVDMSRLSTTSKDTLDTLYQMTYSRAFNSNGEGGVPTYDFNSMFQVCMEVLRGAPIDMIDKDVEGIGTANRIDKAGIVAAAKFEELCDSLKTESFNSSLYIPSMAFMPGMSYFALMVFKVMLLVVIIVNMVTVYFDAVSEQLGIGTAWKCTAALLLSMLVIFTVPAVFEATYYQANRLLLQDEAVRIAMLNREKKTSGVEIGVTQVTEPNIDTELFINIEQIRIPWYNLFYDAIFTDTYKTVTDLYDNYAKEHIAASIQNGVVIKNNGVYVSVDDIFNSSSVDLDMSIQDTNTRRLVQTATVNRNVFSWYSPYYAILDALIENVNYFNANPWGDESSLSGVNGWYSYTMKEQRGGKYKTMGLIEPYLTSEKFLELPATDICGIREIYKDQYTGTMSPDPAMSNFYSAENLERMKKAGWYATDISSVELEKRLEYLNDRARRFVAKNRELLGKISDDTFLKAMALDLAIEHNKAFNIHGASSFEIYSLSNDDLMRLSIADSKDVLLNSTLSYPRFVYSVGGSVTVFAAAILQMVLWLSSVLKPILVLVAFFTIFISVFVFRICMNKNETSLYGYVITTLLLCGTNVLYSVILKLSMYIPRFGFTPLMCIIFQIVLQIAYLVLLLEIVATAFRDWHDLGFAEYVSKFENANFGFAQKLFGHKTTNPLYGGSTQVSDPEKNWGYYQQMLNERKRRGG